MKECNFNITFPIFDKVFGTGYKAGSSAPGAEKRQTVVSRE